MRQSQYIINKKLEDLRHSINQPVPTDIYGTQPSHQLSHVLLKNAAENIAQERSHVRPFTKTSINLKEWG
jgi:hypothetical protein